jgi:hypothetical protein
MVGKSGKGGDGASMHAAQDNALAAYCPDLEQWPQSWSGGDTDIPVGQTLIEFFKPFLLHMLDQDLAKTTLHRHRDHLWVLGGELIRRRYDDAKLKKMSVDKAIAEMIEEDGGPLIWPRLTEAEQNSFDATCRKLYKFLKATPKSAL